MRQKVEKMQRSSKSLNEGWQEEGRALGEGGACDGQVSGLLGALAVGTINSPGREEGRGLLVWRWVEHII